MRGKDNVDEEQLVEDLLYLRSISLRWWELEEMFDRSRQKLKRLICLYDQRKKEDEK